MKGLRWIAMQTLFWKKSYQQKWVADQVLEYVMLEWMRTQHMCDTYNFIPVSTLNVTWGPVRQRLHKA